MSEFNYEFEDVEIKIGDTTVWVSGALDVGYTSSRPERSTGWLGGVEIDGYGEMVVTVSQGDDEAGPFFYHRGHPVFDAILKACDTDIEDAAKDDCRWD